MIPTFKPGFLFLRKTFFGNWMVFRKFIGKFDPIGFVSSVYFQHCESSDIPATLCLVMELVLEAPISYQCGETVTVTNLICHEESLITHII